MNTVIQDKLNSFKNDYHHILNYTKIKYETLDNYTSPYTSTRRMSCNDVLSLIDDKLKKYVFFIPNWNKEDEYDIYISELAFDYERLLKNIVFDVFNIKYLIKKPDYNINEMISTLVKTGITNNVLLSSYIIDDSEKCLNELLACYIQLKNIIREKIDLNKNLKYLNGGINLNNFPIEFIGGYTEDHKVIFSPELIKCLKTISFTSKRLNNVNTSSSNFIDNCLKELF